ncbi:hypothetical protein BRC19_01730 [Candidatus Saccharibacteria bacterium QS_5_54_17]|nr:MAG: hypothetical protein BRC19_01730 [Candidatus Saccharibacteria bacterium QS_5_54_17]
MNRKQAREAGRQILRDEEPGTTVHMVSEGMANNNPHPGQDGSMHSDSWVATKGSGGGVSVSKDHAPE